jgi:hypothetical protein
MKYILLILCIALVGCEKKTDLNKAVVAVNNQQNEKIDEEFLIVKSEGISSKFNANHYVRICEHLPMSELKKRFQNYNVYLHKESPVHEYAKIKNEYFDINIWLDDKNKVKFIDCISGCADIRGNKVGTKLRIAIGDKSMCDNTEYGICDSKIYGMSYIVNSEVCKFDFKYNEETAIPECGEISSFSIGC